MEDLFGGACYSWKKKTHETPIVFITPQSQHNRALDRIMIQLFEGYKCPKPYMALNP